MCGFNIKKMTRTYETNNKNKLNNIYNEMIKVEMRGTYKKVKNEKMTKEIIDSYQRYG